MTLILDNWQWVLITFYVAEKIVKLSPLAWDDILVDGIKSIALKLYDLFKDSR